MKRKVLRETLGATQLLQLVRELNEWIETTHLDIGFWVETNGDDWRVKAGMDGAIFDLFSEEDTGAFILDAAERKRLDNPEVVRGAILRLVEKRLSDAAEQLDILKEIRPIGGW